MFKRYGFAFGFNLTLILVNLLKLCLLEDILLYVKTKAIKLNYVYIREMCATSDKLE